MVWFQCEDCGENLKKPKLPNHFRICSASKLSCIDCGETFGQQSVQGHNQCITEAEKYGPKGQGKVSYGTHTKANNESKQKPDVDINVGLSARPPWFCSLCNTNATSKQALLLHADGKKHRAKARAFHAAKQQSEQTDNSTPNMKASIEDHKQRELSGNKNTEEPKPQEAEDSNQLELPREVVPNNNLVPENGNSSSKRKRKLNTSESESSRKKNDDNYSGDVSNGEVIQAKRAQVEEPNCVAKKSSSIDTNNKDNINESVCMDQNISNKIKWKKLISTILKSNLDGVLKTKKLQKLVLKALLESGITDGEAQLKDMLMQKIDSSSRFRVEGKFVYLVRKN